MVGERNNYGKRSHARSDYSENGGGSKRRNHDKQREQYPPAPGDTVYRYLCPGGKIGSIIGKGGEIVKQLRQECQSKIRIDESVPGCEERVVTIFSSSEETNAFGGSDQAVCPALDALFRIHERVVANETLAKEDIDEGSHRVTARLLVPSDQIGCVIGKGGQVVQNIRTDTGAQIRILKNEHLPLCAMTNDELLQINGEASVVKKALHQVASRLHDNPSRSQHLLNPSMRNMYQQGQPNASAHIMALAPILGSYRGYKGDLAAEWSSRSYYPPPRDDGSAKEFNLRLVCPASNIGGVIGKGGEIIKQIRQESKAFIKVDSTPAEGDDCIISISTKEYFEEPTSSTIEAAVRLHSRCSEKTESKSGEPSYTTRLLVPTSRIGCLIGKSGAVINEMRRLTRANIRIFPVAASQGDEMVQISGDLVSARTALVQVMMRLKANLFEKEGALSSYSSAVSYTSPQSREVSTYGGRSNRSDAHGYSSHSSVNRDSGAALSSDNYGASQSGRDHGYESYRRYSTARSGNTRLSGQNPVSHGRHHGY